MRATPAIDRLMATVIHVGGPLDTDCWISTLKSRCSIGYVQISRGPDRGSKKALGHRLAYEAYVGPIPAGHEIDHLCSAPACVNPDHLEAVLPRVNKSRSSAPSAMAARTNRCARGHSLDDAYKNGPWRSCRTCREIRLGRRAA